MSKEPVAGGKAPAFTLPRDGGGKVSLNEFKGRNLVLYFYPKADTPGLHQGGTCILTASRRIRQGRYRDPRGLCRPSAFPGQIQIQT